MRDPRTWSDEELDNSTEREGNISMIPSTGENFQAVRQTRIQEEEQVLSLRSALSLPREAEENRTHPGQGRETRNIYISKGKSKKGETGINEGRVAAAKPMGREAMNERG